MPYIKKTKINKKYNNKTYIKKYNKREGNNLPILFKELQILTNKMNDCLFINCNSIMSKESIDNVLNDCNDRVKHIKSSSDRTKQKKMCIGKGFTTTKETSDVFQKLMQCNIDKCKSREHKSERDQYSKLLLQISEILNPESTKIPKLYKKIEELYKEKDKCGKEEKCKSYDKEIDLLYDEIHKIRTKTDDLLLLEREKYEIKDLNF